MKKHIYLSMITIFFISLALVNRGAAYIPEDQIVLNQIPNTFKTRVNNNVSVGIILKNYKNFTLTNITISLNLTADEDLEPIRFTSCYFGVLSDENVTLNHTIESTSEFGFTPVNITEGYMTEKYLEIKVEQLTNGSKLLFRYNVTSDEEGKFSFPRVKMTYYDNWGDKKKIESKYSFQLEFTAIEEWTDDIPRWKGGLEIPTGWAILIFGLTPIFVAITTSYIFTVRIKQ
ncbi:MAG: hypothetical protein ACTSQE_00450 [Candidatus Heimdallarchaeaceae archaeon]